MKTLLAILRAAHCRSTHHYFAIDALPLVQTEDGQRLARLLLRYHSRYLVGAKDPDTRFRDFQNHVVHVDEGYWGGAPRVAHQWYERLLRFLRNDRWSDAAYAAGVLSHYFTDPMQPLHTAQTEKEKILHRPLEWSITKSYQQIFQYWIDDELRVVFQLSDRSSWLGEAILHGARFANRKYDLLLDHYCLEKGVKDPPQGFDEPSREALSELFGLAITGWARVLERAALDAETLRQRRLPNFALSFPTFFSAVQVPLRLWVRRIESKVLQAKIAALYDEYQRTGDVQENLPSEVDIVHRVTVLYREELQWKAERDEARSQRETVIEVNRPNQKVARSASENADAPSTLSMATGKLRYRLSLHDNLVDAPSIGPKTAARFTSIGIHRVNDFLAGGAADLADQLATRWITGEKVALWQTQATLMCQVPGLLARDAQMLAGAGVTDAASLADRDASLLHQDILRYATTAAGRRDLRDAKPPSRAEIAKWIDSVSAAHTASGARAVSEHRTAQQTRRSA